MANAYPEITIIVPENIDYDRIFKKIPEIYKLHKGKFPTVKLTEKVKESVYLFISFLYLSDDFEIKYRKKGYYRPIMIKDFRSITHVLDGVVLQLLTDSDYPIIDICNHYIVGKKPKSYRLRFEHWFKERPQKEIKICSIISQNYIEKITPKPLDSHKNKDSNFDYLKKSYATSIISVCPKVYVFIDQYEKKLLNKLPNLRSGNKKEFFLSSISIKVNKLKNHVKKIQEGNYNIRMSPNNRRFYSELTYCNKEIRSYLKFNNNEVCEIDIKSSHLYILSTTLNKNFITETDDDFSLNKIYNKLFNKLNTSYNLIENNKLFRFINLNNYYNSFKIKDVHNLSFKYPSMLLYMMRLFENIDVTEYKSLPFNEGLYDHLNDKLFENEEDKKYIKRNIMFFLNLIKFRNNNKLVGSMGTEYSTVNEIIRIFNGNDYDDGNLSILLQRVESYLLLEVGIREVLKIIPELDFITVHDSVVVEKKYHLQIKEILEKSISNITGIPIGFDFKPTMDPIDSIDEIVDNAWSKISASYSKAQRKRNVLD